MTKNILITGGTGLIGKQLSNLLIGYNHKVAHLTRNPQSSTFKTFFRDYNKNEIDPEAIEFADIIIHLAGENISNRRWTTNQKKTIIESRVKTTNLLFQAVKKKIKKLMLLFQLLQLVFMVHIHPIRYFMKKCPPVMTF